METSFVLVTEGFLDVNTLLPSEGAFPSLNTQSYSYELYSDTHSCSVQVVDMRNTLRTNLFPADYS